MGPATAAAAATATEQISLSAASDTTRGRPQPDGRLPDVSKQLWWDARPTHTQRRSHEPTLPPTTEHGTPSCSGPISLLGTCWNGRCPDETPSATTATIPGLPQHGPHTQIPTLPLPTASTPPPAPTEHGRVWRWSVPWLSGPVWTHGTRNGPGCQCEHQRQHQSGYGPRAAGPEVQPGIRPSSWTAGAALPSWTTTPTPAPSDPFCSNAAGRAAEPAYAPPKPPPESAPAPNPDPVTPCPPSSGILPLPLIHVPYAGFGNPNTTSPTRQTP